jgi:hypothetical protein
MSAGLTVKSAGAMDYLGRYVNRTAIGNHRILKADDHEVSIKVMNRKTQKSEVVSMTPKEFVGRFVAHILPRKFTRIRWYGFLACPLRRKSVEMIRELLGKYTAHQDEALGGNRAAMVERLAMSTCSVCKKGKYKLMAILPPLRR